MADDGWEVTGGGWVVGQHTGGWAGGVPPARWVGRGLDGLLWLAGCLAGCDQGQVIFAAEENPEAFTRGSGSPNVSGTKMREALGDGNFEEFASGLPAGVNAQNVWNILMKTNEGRKRFSLVEALFGGRF